MPKLAVNIIIDSRRHMDGSGRTWSAISVLLHLAVALSLLLAGIVMQQREAARPRVYRVSIASLPGGADPNLKTTRTRTSSEPAPAAKPKKAPPAPVKKPAVKRSRPKPEQKPVVGIDTKRQSKPKKKPEPLLDAPIVRETAKGSTPRATGGGTPRVGFSSQGSIFDVDGASFEYSYYLGLVQDRIGSNWVRTYVGKGKVKIYFRIRKNGRIESAMIEESSGDPGLDRLALQAVTASDPLPPLPEGYSGSVLGIHIWFNYEE